MAEDLAAADVQAYTKGRLLASDAEVTRALNAALARVRRYCGWHVSPVRTQTITLDGTGAPLLFLPTMKVVTITAITEDGDALVVADIKESVRAPGVLIKENWAYWSCEFESITVALQHGYTAAEAADFREAVLSLVDKAATEIGAGGEGPLLEKEIDDVRYRWSAGVESVPMNTSSLSQFRLLL